MISPATPPTYLISELAEAAGMGVETVRFYERKGLLPAPPRSASGYRLYRADDVRRAKIIRRARTLGFSLAEIAALLDEDAGARCRAGDHHSGNTCPSCEPVMQRVQEKIDAIDRRIAELQQMRDALQQLHDDCPGGDLDACRVMAALAGGVDRAHTTAHDPTSI
ncbi:MAG: heavy metal-responsive transcriptional regulator [Planctomycetota bacterium]